MEDSEKGPGTLERIEKRADPKTDGSKNGRIQKTGGSKNRSAIFGTGRFLQYRHQFRVQISTTDGVFVGFGLAEKPSESYPRTSHLKRTFRSHLEANRMQSAETEDRWYVEVGGAPKMMTLDQLVEAFEAGVINSKSLVTEVGGTEWKPLSEVADLGEEEEAPLSVQAPPVYPSAAPVASMAPARAVAAQSFPPPVARPAPSAWPPVVASRPPGSVAPSVASSVAPSSALGSIPPVSTMPVVQDLSLALDNDFAPRRSKAPFVAAAAVLLLVGGALAAARFGGGGEIMKPVAVPAAAPAPVALNTATSEPTPTPAPAAAPAPSTTSESTTSTGDKSTDAKASDSSASRLSEDTKSKLKDADKTRADKKKAAKASHKSAPARSSSKSSSSGVFRNGGNANDPLNSKL